MIRCTTHKVVASAGIAAGRAAASSRRLGRSVVDLITRSAAAALEGVVQTDPVANLVRYGLALVVVRRRAARDGGEEEDDADEAEAAGSGGEDDEENESSSDESFGEIDLGDDDEDEEIDLELRNKIEEALRVHGIKPATEEDDEDEDEELMDDDQMMAIDAQLAQVFQARANEKKGTKSGLFAFTLFIC